MTVGLAQAPTDRPAPPGAVVFIINQSAHCAKVQSRMLPCPDIYPPDIYIPEKCLRTIAPSLPSAFWFNVWGFRYEQHCSIGKGEKKVKKKVAHSRLPSVGFQS